MYNFVLDSKQEKDANLVKASIIKETFPIQLIQDTEAGIAHIHATEDPDGIFRHYSLLSNIDEIYFPSISLMSYEYFTKDKPLVELLGVDQYEVKLKTGRVKLLSTGETRVRYIGGKESFPAVSVIDILEASDQDTLMKETLNNTIVLYWLYFNWCP